MLIIRERIQLDQCQNNTAARRMFVESNLFGHAMPAVGMAFFVSSLKELPK